MQFMHLFHSVPAGLRRDLGVWSLVIAGHILFACALCWRPAMTAQKPEGEQGQMVAVSLVASVVPAASQVAKLRTEAEDSPRPVEDEGLEPVSETKKEVAPALSDSEMELVGSFQPASMGEPGTACNLTQQLATAFGQSPEVRQGIAAIPASGRSVANAVMLWDGHWAEGTQAGGMAVLRALLVKAVVSARPECLQAQNQGPVLFLIPDNKTTIVLAIGSGQWRWADVVMPSPQPDVIAANF